MSNSREKEIQKVLQRANYIIHKQKIEIEKQTNYKSLSTTDTCYTIPQTSRSTKETDTFNLTGIEPDAKMALKEKELELHYQTKVVDMKLNLEEIKEKFDERCRKLKKQLMKVQKDLRNSESQGGNTDRYKSEISAKYLNKQTESMDTPFFMKEQIESNRYHAEKLKDLED